MHALRDAPNVVDIRTLGLTAAIELAPRDGAPGKRGFEAVETAFWDGDAVMRQAGDAIVLTPPLIIAADEIAALTKPVRPAIHAVN